MLNEATRSDSATEDVRLDRDTPVTLGMLLDIAKSAHRSCHMPDAPPSLGVAYVDAIEDLIPNPYRGG